MTRLLLVAAALVVVLAAAGVAAGAEWDVYPGAGTPIQTAIDGAGEGDTIYVHAGTYVENVDVNKRVTLIGEGADVVTVRASDHVFEVTADWVKISGFTATGTTTTYCGDGIHLSNANHCSVSDNSASNIYGGICLYYSNNNTLASNTANSNTYRGIFLCYSNNNMLHGNTANSNNKCGICMSGDNNTLKSNIANSNNECGICMSGNNNTLKSNTMSGNTYNFGVDGYAPSHYPQNIDPSNIVDGKPIYYWIDQQDKQIPCDAGYVGIVNCTNITVRDLTLTNNKQGILFAYTDNSRIENVNTSDNYNGIFMLYSSNNTLQNGTVNSNNWSGIRMESSSNNTLQSNTMSGNTYNFGVYGYALSHHTRNIDPSNTVDGKPIYYWIDQQDKQIPDDAGFVGVVNSTNITVKDLTLTKSYAGALFVYTENSKIENVNASNNENGVRLWFSNSNTLQNNIANSNNNRGILIGYSSNNTLMDNTVSNNGDGIFMGLSSNNTLQGNTGLVKRRSSSPLD